MKYLSKAKVYKGANVQYDPFTMRAMSYWWWVFMRKFGDVVIFNEHRYSPTTSRHQHQVKELAALDIDVYVRTEYSLDKAAWLDDALKNAERDLISVNERIPSSRISDETRARLKHRRIELEAALFVLKELKKKKDAKILPKLERLLSSLHGDEE